MLSRGLAWSLTALAAAARPGVHAVEVGGSSVQTAVLDRDGAVQFRSGPRPDLDAACYGLSAPGLVVDGRVFGAHHLGWDGVEAWRELGYAQPPTVSMNDAEAAALGEWLLRQDRADPPGRLLYAAVGTGVAGCLVADGVIVAVELSHQPGFGDAVCGGCGRTGCLDAQIGGHALPPRLTPQDRRTVSGKLTQAITRTGVAAGTLIVLAGGLARSYPDLVTALRDGLRGSHRVEATAAPADAKSAAYAAIFHRLAQTCPGPEGPR